MYFSPNGFSHITDVLNGNAIATLFFAIIAIISVKLIVTVIAAMVRDDARETLRYETEIKEQAWYQREIEGKEIPAPSNLESK